MNQKILNFILKDAKYDLGSTKSLDVSLLLGIEHTVQNILRVE